jgi:tRNA-binding protein
MTIEWDDFEKVNMHVGTIISAEPNEKARKPAYVLKIDFGETLGIKASSAQITTNYTPTELVGLQVVAVTNFPPKRIAGVKSEVLVLGAISPSRDVVLLTPSHLVENGTHIS